MRKVVLGLGISLDVYIARPDGSVDFLFMPKDYSMGPFFATIDTLIMRRKTLDAGKKLSGGTYKPETPTYAFSRTEPPGKRDGLDYVNQSPASLIKELRNRPVKA